MRKFAAKIKTEFESLTLMYADHIREMPGYNDLSFEVRWEMARADLELVADCLATGDDSGLIELALSKAEAPTPMAVLTLLEELLMAQVESLQGARFLWHAFSEARTQLCQRLADRASQMPELILEALVEHLPQHIFWKDRNLTYLGGNRGFARDAGFQAPAEVVGKSDYDLAWTKDEADFFRKVDAKVMEEGKPHLNFEEPVTTAAGATNWVRTSKIPIHDETGQVVALLGMYEDITAQRETEAERERLAAILEATSDLVAIANTEAQVIYMNRAGRRMLGLADDLDITTHRIPDSHPQWAAERVLNEGLPAAMQTGIWSGETALRGPNGTEIPVSQVVIVHRGAGGAVEYLSTIMRDISSRKQVEQSLRQSQQMLQLVMDNIPQTVFWKDHNLVYLGGNRKFIRDAGLASLEELVGKSDYDLAWAKEEADFFRQIDRRVMEEGVPQLNFEEPVTTAAGATSWVRTSKIPIRNEAEQVVALLGMYEDITVQRQTQAERERLAAILEATTDLVAVTNPQGQVIYLNRAGRKMVGFPDDLDITTTTIPDYHPRWAFERVLNEGLPAAMQTGIWSGETALLHRSDEAEIPVSQVIIVHRRADGEVEYLSTVMRDISDRKRLEQEIQESLARRARQVETSAEVAQEISAAPILAELFRRVVNLVKERFGYYHAHIYTLEQDTLVMQEGAGDAGRHMKAAGHQIPYDAERSLVARAARSGTPVLVADVTQEPDWLPNPLLPHTKSELAVPVKLRDELLGVLDVQSDRVAGLSDEDEIVLIGLCGQIASAIESTRRLQAANMFRQFAEESGQGFGWATLDGQVVYMNPTLAHLLGQPDSKQLIGQSMIPFYPPQIRQHLQADILPAVQTSGHWSGELFLLSAKGNIIPILETFFLIRDEQNAPRYLATVITDITEQKRAEVELQERLHELDTLYRTMSQEGWRTFLETTDLSAGYFFDQTTLRPLDEANIPEAKLALTQKRLISAPDGATVMPLLAHDLPLGVLGVYEDPQQPLAPEELALLEAVSEQVALALESARFFQQTRQASFLLDERIKELNCLNDIGREMDDAPSLPDFLQWVTERIPAAMRHPEICSAAIEYDGQLYGQAGAIQLPCQITNALRVGGEVVGRLYIAYSEKHDFLNEESALIGGISRRVSGYIENRRLLAETQEALAQTERAQRRYTVQAWETYRAKRGLLQYEQTHPTLLASPPELASSTSIIAAGDATLVVPLTVHDRVIGALGLQERVDGRPWLPEEVALVEAVAEQMAQAAEGLRLLDETQQQAAREQLARQITDKVRASQNIEAALKTAAQELAAALGTARAVIDLQLAPEDGAQNE